MNKILVVDDIESNRILLRKMLTALKKYEIIEAVNGKDAIEVYEKNTPDLILMDINMPEMDGFQSANRIKELAGDNYTPIIFVTAMSESSLASALASGGDDFISKPFKVEVLESKINAHLRIRELNLQLDDKNQQLIRHNLRLTYEQELIEHFFNSALEQSFLEAKFIKYHMSSMSTFNGDLFLVERGPKGGLYIVMGDFTGHGLTAAMGTLPVAMIFFKMASKGMLIEQIAREINFQLNKLMPVSMFFAATLIALSPQGDSISVWAGGMPESYLLAKNGELKFLIQSQHMALGVLKDKQFDAAINLYNVATGDKIYLYSDGITEAHRSDGEMFGNERLKEILLTNGDKRFEQVLIELKKFTGLQDQNDDITLVEMTCHDIPAVTQS
jgi:CheY-like chemotaxis protein